MKPRGETIDGGQREASCRRLFRRGDQHRRQGFRHNEALLAELAQLDFVNYLAGFLPTPTPRIALYAATQRSRKQNTPYFTCVKCLGVDLNPPASDPAT